MGTEKYGAYYWCIKTELSEDGEIYLMADEMEVTPTGALVCRGKERRPVLGIPAGKWSAYFAASIRDGHAVALEHWKGELAEGFRLRERRS
jgi:hypothetical protein